MDVIYLIEDSSTGLKYIGSKKDWKGNDSYWGSPCCKCKTHKKYILQQQWNNAMINHKESFSFKILEQFDNIEQFELLKVEKRFQKQYDVINDNTFINASYAGGTGFMGKGKDNPMFGRRHTNKSKRLMSEHQKENGERYSKERKGISKKDFLGEEKYEIFIKKISDHAKTRIGEKNSFYGKHHSEASKKKMGESLKGRKPTNTKQVFIEGEIYDGLNDAFIATGIKPTTIWHRIHSPNKKYINFKYI